MKTVLETDRLVLRHVIPNDDEFLFALMNEPAFHQNIGDRGIRTLADARAYIRWRKIVDKYFRRSASKRSGRNGP